MLAWSTILYGAVLSAVAAGVLVVAVRRARSAVPVAVAAVSAAAGAFVWNAILHRVHADEFFVDAPVGIMPASWQDTGSGVFALAAASLAYGFGPLRREPAHLAALLATLCGLAAFLVDVYLY
jgi:hypothetical protein